MNSLFDHLHKGKQKAPHEAESAPKAIARPKTIQPSTGVRVEPAPHGANVISPHGNPLTTFETLLAGSCHKEFNKIRNNHIIQTSFPDINADSPALPASNGFVDSVVLAYNQHHHLVIRPEDVWFSILVQVNLYINAHAEEMRSMFVAHKGQKELKLWVGKDPIGGKPGTSTMFGVDWAKFAYQIGKKIEENIHDPTLRDWFMPAFTTTTKTDQATASIIMMSAMQKYFSYGCGICCGLPSVTLLGQKRDWEEILSRLERLKTFGAEPTRFYELLKPVVKKFVETFDDPDSEEIKDFWQHIAHYSGGGSGPTYLSGWITAFCFWSGAGKCFYKPGENPSKGAEMRGMGRPTPVLVLDGTRYHRIETSDVPPGYASVPVELDDNGFITKAEMVAGSVGMMISTSGLELEDGNHGLDTIQPGSGWCMYEIMSEEENLERARIAYEKRRETSKWLPEWKGKESLEFLGWEF